MSDLTNKIQHRTFILVGSLILAVSLILIAFYSGNPLSTQKQQHILILAVDQFGYENLKCNHEHLPQQKSGIETLCHDSIRYTHAYTTSQNTRPALASIFTGKAPFEHGVQDNDTTYLRAAANTIAEDALSKGFETAFFIGSPASFRDSGLQQGFLFFDDHFSSENNLPFRHFYDTQQSYLSWRLKRNKSTFAVIHVPDLYFKNRQTQTELGEARNYSYDSQLEEFDNSLFQFLATLKKLKEYDNTLIVFTGLNTHRNESSTTDSNLDFNEDQIALLIKPTQKPRDMGLAWTFDENVSLTDIATTVRTVIGSKFPIENKKLLTASILPINGNQHISKIESRWVVSETYSHYIENPAEFSLRKDQYHILSKNQNLKVFNTLIDKLENSPLSHVDNAYKQYITEAKDLIAEIQSSGPKSRAFEHPELLVNIFENFLSKNKNIDQKNLKEFYFTLLKTSQASENPCLNELAEAHEKNELQFCREKKFIMLHELAKTKGELTENQKKKILNYALDLRHTVQIAKKNMESGFVYLQPTIELQKWLPFILALQQSKFAKIKNLFILYEGR